MAEGDPRPVLLATADDTVGDGLAKAARRLGLDLERALGPAELEARLLAGPPPSTVVADASSFPADARARLLSTARPKALRPGFPSPPAPFRLLLLEPQAPGDGSPAPAGEVRPIPLPLGPEFQAALEEPGHQCKVFLADPTIFLVGAVQKALEGKAWRVVEDPRILADMLLKESAARAVYALILTRTR